LSTIHFASQAKQIKTKALVNEDLNDQAQLKRQQKEIAELQTALKVSMFFSS
jgi:hypothetical protein